MPFFRLQLGADFELDIHFALGNIAEDIGPTVHQMSLIKGHMISKVHQMSYDLNFLFVKNNRNVFVLLVAKSSEFCFSLKEIVHLRKKCCH